jgi:hypothetical protein
MQEVDTARPFSKIQDDDGILLFFYCSSFLPNVKDVSVRYFSICILYFLCQYKLIYIFIEWHRILKFWKIYIIHARWLE